MTVPEFKAWLDGYMEDRKNPSLKVIVAKVSELSAPNPYQSGWWVNTPNTTFTFPSLSNSNVGNGFTVMNADLST